MKKSAEEFAAIWEAEHLTSILPSNARHADLQNYFAELEKLGLNIEKVGASFGGKSISKMIFGAGKTRVMFWSQMHGDEPTATSALIDLFAFLQKNRMDETVKLIEKNLTLCAVPMINPDGADLYRRRNLQWIDINRDARDLETPEGRILKNARDEFAPHIGFNLHNQNHLTSIENSFRQATISLLAVPGNAENKTYPGHERNRRLCALMIAALEKFIPGHIGRYDDAYNPRAFGDQIAAWGTPTILIETGGLFNEDEMFRVKLNFVAYLTALGALASGAEANADASLYDNLPSNAEGVISDVIFRRANIVNLKFSDQIFTADVAVVGKRCRAEEKKRFVIRDVGDLAASGGLTEFRAKDFLLVTADENLQAGVDAKIIFYRKEREIDWNAPDFTEKFAPDAIFQDGAWLRGADVLPKIENDES